MITHWIADTVTCRSRPIVSMATLTIVVSSSDGIAPRSKIEMRRISDLSSLAGEADESVTG